MNIENAHESINSSKGKPRVSESLIQRLSECLIYDLNAGRGDYIERRDDYIDWLDGADKFPNKIAHDMIRAGRGDEVYKHIEKFEPTQTLAKALLKDMLKNGFYENPEERNMGYHGNLLEDSVRERETFLSRFENLDKSTAILVLKLLEKNMYTGADAIYKSHLGDCFNLKYFSGLDEEILQRLSARGVVIKDEDKSRFVGIDKEKWDKYTNIALTVQDEADEARDKLDEELNGMEEN